MGFFKKLGKGLLITGAVAGMQAMQSEEDNP